MARRLALGLDFGTESARALLVDCDGGAIVGQAVHEYAHGVMEEAFLDGRRLPPDFALQHPDDYLESMTAAARAALQEAGAAAGDVIGIGVDFTACTMLPVDEALVPLCHHDAFRHEPHAYVKLWKHHGANDEAAAINHIAAQRAEPWLARYGGTTSSEWMLAKAWETLRKAPAVYQAAARYVEASDWVVANLCGALVRGACAAGYKGLWLGAEGFIPDATVQAFDPGLAGFFEQKMAGPVRPAGVRAGGLTDEWAGRLGLRPGIAVSPAIIDAHAAVPGCGVMQGGEMVIILGTSSCHMLMSEHEVLVPGIQGVVQDGILPGLFGYEAGQAATGDIVDWAVDRLWSGHHTHDELTAAAARIPAGGTGLLALDWWNGNRSILINPELSGVILGLTRGTRPPEIYRALIEATAFGTRRILDNFQEHGVPVEALSVCGGIAEKNELWLQIYADVTGRPLRRAASPQVCALGAAIFGAVAAGAEGGGFADVRAAVAAMVPADAFLIQPTPGNHKVYDRLYEHWRELHDYLGREHPERMAFLRSLRTAGETA